MKSLAALVLVSCALIGCNRASQSQEAIRAGVISVDALPARANEVFGKTSGSRITAFVTDVVDFNWRVATGEGSTWHDAVGNGVAVGMSPAVLEVA